MFMKYRKTTHVNTAKKPFFKNQIIIGMPKKFMTKNATFVICPFWEIFP